MTQEIITQNVNIAESLEDIGGRLQSIRQQQAIELESIAQKTQIPLKHLKSIEKGEIQSLPELVYVRGFIKRYAQALKQDEASYDLAVNQPAVNLAPSKPKVSLANQVGGWIKRMQYPLYGLLVVAVGSGLVYLNNREFSPTPAQTNTPEAPLTSQNSTDAPNAQQ